MTRDDLLRMACEAGFSVRRDLETPKSYDHIAGYGDALERFAELVAAAEREECAAKMDAIAHQCRMEDSDCEPFVYAAAAIRARGGLCQDQ